MRTSLKLVTATALIAAVLFVQMTSVSAQTQTAAAGSACFTFDTPTIAVDESERESLSLYLREAEVENALKNGLSSRCLGERKAEFRENILIWMSASERFDVPRITVEYWRPLVSFYFEPEDVDWAVRIIDCESEGNPFAKNSRSSASGLFQHLASAWEKRSADAGWAGAPIWDPEANIAVAAWLFYEGGGKSHWTCKG